MVLESNMENTEVDYQEVEYRSDFYYKCADLCRGLPNSVEFIKWLKDQEDREIYVKKYEMHSLLNRQDRELFDMMVANFTKDMISLEAIGDMFQSINKEDYVDVLWELSSQVTCCENLDYSSKYAGVNFFQWVEKECIDIHLETTFKLPRTLRCENGTCDHCVSCWETKLDKGINMTREVLTERISTASKHLWDLYNPFYITLRKMERIHSTCKYLLL